jgi:hypothetical protein
MIGNGSSMKCGGRCENLHVQIGLYHLKSHVISIEMGDCNIVLGARWLHTLGPITMDFKELTMRFQHDGQQYHFQSVMEGSLEIISAHRMKKLLKKGNFGIIAQLHAIQAIETPSPTIHTDIQSLLSKH